MHPPYWLAVIVPLLAAGCESISGSGPITLSPRAQAQLNQYMQHSSAGAFAVPPDGSVGVWYYCDEASVRCANNTVGSAVRLCNQYANRQDCKIYAVGHEIVWKESSGASSP